jgi:hypothetical protein
MTTLAKDQPRDYFEGSFEKYPVVATGTIFQGAAVGENGSGYVRPLVAGDPFKGFNEIKVDNANGDAGDKDARVKTVGFIKLPIASLAITDEGKDIYASDDDTFSLTPGSNTRIGYVHKWLSSGYGLVAFSAANGDEVVLTDSSGGTASETIAAISGAYVQAEVANGFASLATKINYLLQKMGN